VLSVSIAEYQLFVVICIEKMTDGTFVPSSSTLSKMNIIEQHTEQGTKFINLVTNIDVSHFV